MGLRMQAVNMLEDSLPDLSFSEVRVLKAVALGQREQNSTRGGQLKFWSAIYVLLEMEQQRRRRVVEKQELDFYGIDQNNKNI